VGTHLKIIGLSITASSGSGIDCGPSDPNATPVPSLELDNMNIDTEQFVLLAYPCYLVVRQSHFNARTVSPAAFIASPSTATFDRCVFEGGGVESAGAGASVRVSNSLFFNQMSEQMTGSPGPLSGKNFGTATAGEAYASFSTFIGSSLLCGSGLPACAGGTGDGVCIDNSILTSTSGDAVQGAGCSVSHSIAMPQAAALNGSSNLVNVDPLFVGGGSFALKSSSPAVDAADPNAVDNVDLVGTLRPQGPRNDIGAYEYKP